MNAFQDGSEAEWEMMLFKNEELINYLTALQVSKSVYEYVVYDLKWNVNSPATGPARRYQALRQTAWLVPDRYPCRQIQP